MDPSSHEGGAQKRTHAKDVLIEADPFTSFLKTQVVFPEETELMMHEYEQPDHDADEPPKNIVKTTFLVQYPWVFLQDDMYFCKDCSTNTKLLASLINDVFFVNCGVAKNKQPG